MEAAVVLMLLMVAKPFVLRSQRRIGPTWSESVSVPGALPEQTMVSPLMEPAPLGSMIFTDRVVLHTHPLYV